MSIQMGRQIRTYRLRCNMTQEKLAERLRVTPQAVSRWENGSGYPDIAILPELAAALGVTVDELFETGLELQLKRISQMLENEVRLSDEDFRYAERCLRDGCLDLERRGQCLTLLGELYAHQAQRFLEQAAATARQALELEPEKKDNHDLLARTGGGVLVDWCYANHSRMVDFYRGFVQAHPRYLPGYLWLMDNLIADGRLSEAKEALEKMRAVEETYHYLLYKGWIAQAGGDWAGAEDCWNKMVEQSPDNWLAWYSRGDAWAKRADYTRAIADFRKAAGLQPKPRYTDSYDCIAQLCILKGDTAAAMDAYASVVQILREDWQMQEGETVQGYLQNIEQLRNK